ncbi:transposase [Streptomyces chattanoogensis]|uniref:Transposase n=1 Tax=Streptomyces chattanoogensis TaxID=66876 RepID=A0A0N0H1N5_9ACTN|nr:transposase [Streptomyces chattanoogensis]
MSDAELWSRIEPLLPTPPRGQRRPGRRKVLADRTLLCGILFVLYTGIQCEWLPGELGFGSGMSCWRRLRDWNNAGVRQRLHEVLLAELRAADRLSLSRAVIDSSHVQALKGGLRPGGARSTEDVRAPTTT